MNAVILWKLRNDEADAALDAYLPNYIKLCEIIIFKLLRINKNVRLWYKCIENQQMR